MAEKENEILRDNLSRASEENAMLTNRVLELEAEIRRLKLETAGWTTPDPQLSPEIAALVKRVRAFRDPVVGTIAVMADEIDRASQGRGCDV